MENAIEVYSETKLNNNQYKTLRKLGVWYDKRKSNKFFI
jgi:hypothetical protein